MRKTVIVHGITHFHEATAGPFTKRNWVKSYLPKSQQLIKIIKQEQLTKRGKYPKKIKFTVEVEKK
jgi:hypothetical protein